MMDARTSLLKSPVDVAEYLFRRLKQVGVDSIHGVPGDYNLNYVEKVGLDWVGNVNELNAAYAADGYARVKGLGAVVTTFGVGELSAINGLAGAFSEFVPVVHVVGTPSTLSQRSGQLLHHTLGNGDFDAFAKMSEGISCAVARLRDPQDIATQIDHAIRTCYVRSRPVYVTLPTDMAQKKVEGERLETPIDLSYPENDVEKEDYVVDVILKKLAAAKSPIILVDACAIRHRALNETHELVRKSGLPTFVAPMGKGAVDETLPNYGGVYAGTASDAEVKEIVENSDLVLSIGALKSDFNTAEFTYKISKLSTIDFHSNLVAVKYSEYPGLRMNGVLRKITANLDCAVKPSTQSIIPPAKRVPQGEAPSSSSEISHAWFWPRMGQWLLEDDVVVTETGTANFGIWKTRFPKGVVSLNQTLWGSIGWSVGACQGAALAARELAKKRTILFVGDGSLQLTVQEISTIIRKRLKPIIFVICNHGFTIERLIHGVDAAYNDIQGWKHTDLPSVFGASSDQFRTFQVRTRDEVDRLFGDIEFGSAPCLQLVEIHLPKMDAPASLKLVSEAAARNNAKG